MDLSQEKLSKAEWNSIEIPVVAQEQKVLKLIMSGFDNPEIRISPNQSIATFMKMTMDESMEVFVFKEFFQPLLTKTGPNLNQNRQVGSSKTYKDLKKADKIRIDNLKKNIEDNRQHIFEFILLDMIREATTPVVKKLTLNKTVFSLIHILQNTTTTGLNTHVLSYIREWIQEIEPSVSVMDIVLKATEHLERNRWLIQYSDLSLFSHQKDLFNLFNKPSSNDPRLVLYIAPTGTGKTLSPLGLAQNGQRVIFVCSARHVGLSLAKSAISVEKKVAFAYGCQAAEDIRLHNFSAVDYIKNKRSGGIGKVDNSNGSRVEIMICDVKSYLIAMRYMLEFHSAQDIILYWDEPTITMDYEEHPLHPLIHQNWTENQIPRIVLSCATLPKRHEIQQTIDHFLLKFTYEYTDLTDFEKEDRFVHNIVSYDCKKTISILDPNNKCVLPHLLFANCPEDLLKSVLHCLQNKALLRYFDLGEIVRFLEASLSPEEITGYFEGRLENVSLSSIKIFYLKVLMEKIEESDEALINKWNGTLIYLRESQQSKWTTHKVENKPFQKSYSVTDPVSNTTASLNSGGVPIHRTTSVASVNTNPNHVSTTVSNPFSGILFTTQDAHTLTDGPTIYIAEDVEKMGLFYIQQTRIPEMELHGLLKKIHNNNLLQKKITIIENEMEDQLGKETLKEKKMEKEQFSREVKQLKGQLELLRSQIEPMSLRPDYIPNNTEHTKKWMTNMLGCCGGGVPFKGNIEDGDVIRIMELDVKDHIKILLLLGIGIFVENASVAYLEVIKTLATEQKLYLIIASSDYIYGTNYPFCHGILGKDLQKMTQQKTIQAMGRIGRNNIQHEYTVRFRNPGLLRNLFLPMEKNQEAVNMCRLFSG